MICILNVEIILPCSAVVPGVDVVVTCVGVVGVGTAVGSVTVVESDEVEVVWV